MNRSLRLISCLATVALLLVGGCADRSAPTGPAGESRPLASQSQGAADLGVLATFNKRPSITIAWAKAWIGPEGGSLDFHGFGIEVPPGAVDRMTQFSIHLPVDPHGSERVVAELGPHGARFNKPVAIEFPLAGTSIEGSDAATVVWWDGSRWVDMGGTAVEAGARLRTETDHFSEYGTMDFSGGVTASGG